MSGRETLRCSAPGLDVVSGAWKVDDFYESQFSDRANFNLDENTVSLVTAVLTSISLLLFVDIVFRVVVRARNGQISKRLIFRQHTLSTFSNPVTLLLSVFTACSRTTPHEDERVEDKTDNARMESQLTTKTSRRSILVLSLVAMVLIMTEFLFIFFATNRVSANSFRPDEVPFFEIEDRGCEYIPVPVMNACSQTRLTKKAGFESRANIQICSSFHISPARRIVDSGNSELAYVLLVRNRFFINAHVLFRESHVNMNYGIYVADTLVDGSGVLFYGTNNVTVENMMNALLSRLQRTNATVLATVGEIEGETSSKAAIVTKRPFQRDQIMREEELTPEPLIGVALDVSNVVLSETHLPIVYNSSEIGNDSMLIVEYFHDLVRSILFPSGRGSAFHGADEGHVDFLLEVEPMVLFNRPWLGIAHSLVVFFVLLGVLAVLAISGVEGTVDPRWAWKEFFGDTSTINDFGNGDDSRLEMGWWRKSNGKSTYGFELKKYPATIAE